MFLVAVVLVSLISKLRFALPIIAVFLLLNYFASPQVGVGFSPGGRLIGSKIKAQKMVDNVQIMGKEFAALPDQRKLLLGKWTIPYVLWEVLEDAADFDIRCSSKEGLWAENMEIAVKRKDNSSYIVRVRVIRRRRPVKIPQPEGWRAWTCESGIRIVESPGNRNVWYRGEI